MCEEVVIPASQVRSLYFSITISDKTELCSVNVHKIHFEEKKEKKNMLLAAMIINSAFYLSYICPVKKKLSCDCYHSKPSFQKSVEK